MCSITWKNKNLPEGTEVEIGKRILDLFKKNRKVKLGVKAE